MDRRSVIVGFVVVAVAATLAVAGYLLIGAENVRGGGAGRVTGHGVLALVLGIVGTVLMAGLLMGLAYFSHRSGHDEKANRPDE